MPAAFRAITPLRNPCRAKLSTAVACIPTPPPPLAREGDMASRGDRELGDLALGVKSIDMLLKEPPIGSELRELIAAPSIAGVDPGMRSTSVRPFLISPNSCLPEDLDVLAYITVPMEVKWESMSTG